MALDGAFLRHLKREIEETAAGARVDRIYQPNRDEILFLLRSRDGAFRLLLSARANSARVHFTRYAPENPKEPPMLCMLLRKKLSGARLAGVRQPELERLLFLDFDSVNELGDQVRLTVAVEVMGRYSNIILIDRDGNIVDALKRVDAGMTSGRLVLPGLRYRLPPPQDKLCLLSSGREEIIERLRAIPGDMELSKALLSSLQGLSPVVCRELAFLTGRGRELTLRGMVQEQWGRLSFFLGSVSDTIRNASGDPWTACTTDGKPLDFSFLRIGQYGSAAVVRQEKSFSGLLDDFYEERDRIARMKARSQDLLRVLTNASDRLNRKINAQRAELEQCSKRDNLRVFGDLVNANLYRLEKGQSSAVLENFYAEGQPGVAVPLDPALSPVQNAQKYYKEYRKQRTAEEILTVQIQRAEQELAYLDTVFEELSRAADEKDLNEIRGELEGEGYFRTQRKSKRRAAVQGPMQFESSDGFRILVGRNNSQNDLLTLRQAGKNDLWFHTKNIPGSHVVLFTQGREATSAAVAEAALLSACYSRGRDSSNVAVDYTLVRNVSKPQGAKPGMVIYVRNKTVFAEPDRKTAEKMRVK
ncbi:fibronectin/fibrinogen-binding protein [Caproiciproducens sp. NJN-50]|uniref:Rqc2 family fibronectin-binding protein n=1 Tax=Acutalibacteraceae TaxID=3082771 RepID=UPI000FFE1360|nr:MULTISPECIES: NFACT RNA binding domain-containing protein [Acutalibacteraceae]QAT49518.1 fibronectin/fibrinogen-binding protein [Caproiciproducens sp. NJN-50]